MLTDTQAARDAIDDTLGGRISLARDSAGLSIEDAADQLGVLVESWTAWECDGSLPRANRITMMAGILGVSPSWLLSGMGQGPTGRPDSTSHGALVRQFHEASQEVAALNRRMAEIAQSLSAEGNAN